jgi:hypothetical protein
MTWDIAAAKGNKEILEKLWCWGGEVQVSLIDDLFVTCQRLDYCLPGIWQWKMVLYEGSNILPLKIQNPFSCSEHF